MEQDFEPAKASDLLLQKLEDLGEVLLLKHKNGQLKKKEIKKLMLFFSQTIPNEIPDHSHCIHFIELNEHEKFYTLLNDPSTKHSIPVKFQFENIIIPSKIINFKESHEYATFVIIKQELNKQLNKKSIEAHKLMNLGALSTSIAHDLCNLQASMRCSAELLKAESCPNELIEILESSIARSQALNQSILNYARGNQDAYCQDPSQAISQWLNVLKKTLRNDQHLHWEASFCPKEIQLSSTELGQIVFNLFFNAQDAIAKSGQTIKFCSKKLQRNQKCYYLLECYDDGHGIEQIHINELFKSTFSTKKKSYSSGLGLAIVESIINNSGGWIEIQSNPGHETCFSLFIPVKVTSTG